MVASNQKGICTNDFDSAHDMIISCRLYHMADDLQQKQH